jgi:hypothetical protein
MKPIGLLDTKLPASLLGGRLTSNQLSAIEELDKMPRFSGLLANIESEEAKWLLFLDHPSAETIMPTPWRQNNPEISKEAVMVMNMIVIKVLRSDRLIHAAEELRNVIISEESAAGG